VLLGLISLYYLRRLIMARRGRGRSTYTIEREVAAHKEWQALVGIGVVLAVAAVIVSIKMFVLPEIDITKLSEPTPTLTLPPATKVFATLTGSPPAASETDSGTPSAEGTPSQTATPSQNDTTAPDMMDPQPAEVPEPTMEPQPTAAPIASSAQVGVAILSPGYDATISGSTIIYGIATHPQFQFYKLEYSAGDQPENWNVFGSLHYQQVDGGTLDSLNTTALPNGVVWLRLTVVDQEGNYPEPALVRVNIQN